VKVTLVQLINCFWNDRSRSDMCGGLGAQVFTTARAPRFLMVMRECSREEVATIVPMEIKFEASVVDLETDQTAKDIYDDFYGYGSVDEMVKRQRKKA
jgi:hypothetical protein